MMTAIANGQAERKPEAKSNSLEIKRERWLRQLMADPQIESGALKVALAIGFHFNRSRGGVAWPGTNTIAAIAHVGRMTVFRTVRKLEERGHLQVTRTRKGRRNLPNRYVPLLKRAAENRNDHVTLRNAVRPPSTIAVRRPGTIAMVPEPYTEPLTEPHIPIRISDAADAAFYKNDSAIEGSEERGIREEGETLPFSISTSTSEPAETLRALCFREAAEHYGPDARPVVAQALDHRGVPEDECLEHIRETIDDGGDLQELAYRLWRP